MPPYLARWRRLAPAGESYNTLTAISSATRLAFLRSFPSRCFLIPQPRIQHIPHRVTQGVEAKHDEEDKQPRYCRVPARGQDKPSPLRHQGAQLHVGGVAPNPVKPRLTVIRMALTIIGVQVLHRGCSGSERRSIWRPKYWADLT